ncbi:efflux RND transporter periplasmic adaptor subunit [Alteraurantiacibacter aquimixticola]|uniref:Efflux RND transporter periplasmic adaptor subunit n=2 Tax=Alteraurantiacibacter aquimixticola TaxID=2489173 RepID=A0A4T3F166_9SPHN|nr:efflux RND transporter periplasmic adaptor subunit [Alteraurantiacibacter aquimixticola]TIX50819.1 efflux RND transporter periplasmic adaptor subunit [Alteraurantiacibacter aquimixticola]
MTPITADDVDHEVGDRPQRRNWLSRPVLAILAGLLTAGAAFFLLNSDDAPAAALPSPVVTIATPIEREVTMWDDYIGRFEASRSVELKPRVSGEITAVHFRDGQFVRQGQPLFTIDPRPYRAALAEAQAGVATARSDLALAQSDLDRALRLVEEDAVAQSEIDTLRARVNAANASLAAAQARVASRSLDAGFTTVRAPISGRISDRRIDPGNQVAAGSTLLTTINAIDPLYFTFDGSEGLFLKARREGVDRGTEVQIRLQDEADYQWTGTLDFTDNGLDARSGTIRARAVIANPEGFLTPGMFGNMRLASGGTTLALLVPDTAIVTDQTRKLLLVVDEEGTVATKEVELGPVADGLRVIRSGIAKTDRVIISGTQLAFPGATVTTRPGTIAPAQEAAARPDVEPLPASAITIGN